MRVHLLGTMSVAVAAVVYEGHSGPNDGLAAIASAATAADVVHGLDIRTDLEATTVVDGNSYARDFEEFNVNKRTREDHLKYGVHAAGLHGRSIKAAMAAGSTKCSHVHCQHKIHNGHCGDGRRAEDCQAFGTSSLRVHHRCSKKNGRSDADKKKADTCIETACDAGHFCAMDGNDGCVCVQLFPGGVVP